MKPVINSCKQDDVVYVENLTEGSINTDKIYAFYSVSVGCACFLEKIDGGYKNQWLFPDEMFQDEYKADTLQELIQELIDLNYKVFEFEDEGEFARWLADIHTLDQKNEEGRVVGSQI